MADWEDDSSTDFEARSSARRAWAKAVVICAIMGGAYGAALGAILGTTDGAARLIGIAAGLMAAVCAVPGVRYGFFFAHVNRLRFGRLFVGTVAAVFGALLGGLFGIVAMMPLGATIGAVGGWFFGRSMSRQDYRFRNGLLGVFLGACSGAAILASRLDEAAALPGTIWGLGIGAVVGPLLFLLFIAAMCSLPHTQGSDKGNWFDEAFRR